MTRVLAALGLIALAAFGRFIPHPANATPIVAMALFSGAAFGRRPWAISIPLIAMLLTDAVIGFHDQMISVYGSLVVIAMIGFALSRRRTVARVAGASLISSLVFFAITNFTVWLSSDMYAHTWSGLVECYTLALPFLRNGAVADLLFSGVLFGAWAVVTSLTPATDSKVLNG